LQKKEVENKDQKNNELQEMKNKSKIEINNQ